MSELKDFVNKNKPKPVKQEAQLLTSREEFESCINSGTALITFFAPGCNHCQKLTPLLDDLATQFSAAAADTNIKIAKIDCTNESTASICHLQDVKSYPMVIMYKNGHRKATYEDSSSKTLNKLMHFVHKHQREDL